MSLTAHILLGLPINLPTGRIRTPSYQPLATLSPAQKDYGLRQTALKERNQAVILEALLNGHKTITALAQETELSVSTVKKAIAEFEQRKLVTRKTGQAHLHHVFTPTKAARGELERLGYRREA